MSSAAEIKLVRGAGFLIYRVNANFTPSKIEYLFLQANYSPFHWTPPKGHVDPGEDEWMAAIREVQEEAGVDSLNKLDIHKDFKYEMRYNTSKDKPKMVTYWLAKARDSELKIKLSNEHKDWKWAELAKANELAKFDEMRKMLAAADEFLVKMNK